MKWIKKLMKKSSTKEEALREEALQLAEEMMAQEELTGSTDQMIAQISGIQLADMSKAQRQRWQIAAMRFVMNATPYELKEIDRLQSKDEEPSMFTYMVYLGILKKHFAHLTHNKMEE